MKMGIHKEIDAQLQKVIPPECPYCYKGLEKCINYEELDRLVDMIAERVNGNSDKLERGDKE